MTDLALLQHDPAVPPRGNSTEDLIRAAHMVLDNCGVEIRPQRVTRIVRQFKSQVERNGHPFVDFLANAVALTADQRRRAAADPDVVRVLGYADPTGETAVRNVLSRSS